jgi:hypothetical protein
MGRTGNDRSAALALDQWFAMSRNSWHTGWLTAWTVEGKKGEASSWWQFCSTGLSQSFSNDCFLAESEVIR